MKTAKAGVSKPATMRTPKVSLEAQQHAAQSQFVWCVCVHTY